MKPRPLVFPSLVVLAGLLPAGCEVDYLAHLVVGQLEGLGRMRPVAQALEDPGLTAEERRKLARTQEIRRFGIEEMGLSAGEAFTFFEADGSEPAAYVLSASARDRLTPYQWVFPFVGVVEYKGFFDPARGRREADLLSERGYDVFFGAVDGFSTLGFFPDPVRQSNLRRDEIDLAEFILHEMTHATVFKPSDTHFNEAMATFVGRAGAQAWFDATYGPDSEESAAARTRFADAAVIDDYVVSVFEQVGRYYEEARQRGASREEIIAGRQAVFEAASARFETEFQPLLGDPERWASIGRTPLDNARILAAVQYQGGLSDFQAVFERTGRSFPDALAVFEEAARRAESREYLRNRVAGR